MKIVTLQILGQEKALEVEKADTFIGRFLGLMGRRGTRGLLLEGCNQIHTFFMRFPLDVYYLDKAGTVVKIDRSVRPWRVRPIVFKARSVLELEAGTASGLEIGSRVTAA